MQGLTEDVAGSCLQEGLGRVWKDGEELEALGRDEIVDRGAVMVLLGTCRVLCRVH